MQRILYYLIQPGVLSTGLMGTMLQVGLAFANQFNVAGAAEVSQRRAKSLSFADGAVPQL